MKPIYSILLTALLFTTLSARELKLLECPSTGIQDIDELKSERLLSDGEGSEFYFKLHKGTTKVFIDEQPRASRISKDLVTLVKMGTTIFGVPVRKGKEAKSPTPPKECILYKQSFKRAEAQLATVDNQNNTTIYNFKAGPTEHLYLSADMPVTNIDELYYDEKYDTIYETEEAASLYLGINYKLGDLFIDYPTHQFYNDIALKGLIKISEKPTESMGLGLAYHLTEGIEIFVAKIWTRSDNNLGRTATTTYGVSFNLNKGLEWVQNLSP